MDTLRKSGKSYRAAFAVFAATATVASIGWLAMGNSKAAAPEKAGVVTNGVERGFTLTLKDWHLLAK